MRWRKIIAALLLIVGIAMIGASLYITQQVDAGQIKIEQAQKSIKTGSQLFSLTPETNTIGKGIADSAQKKISAGQELINYYIAMAQNLKIAGIVLCVIGVVLFLIPKKK